MTNYTLQDVIAALQVQLADANGAEESVQSDSALSELGVDSFTLLELIVFLEGRFSSKFPLHQLRTANLATVQDLAEAYHAALQKNAPPSPAGL